MSQKESNLPIIGGVIAAIGAGLCCAGPFVLLLLGFNAPWNAACVGGLPERVWQCLSFV